MAKLVLFVGIDAYPSSPLAGCVNDATRLGELLQRHADGSPNFECRKLMAPDDQGDPGVSETGCAGSVYPAGRGGGVFLCRPRNREQSVRLSCHARCEAL
jgi:hypothetical protein